MAGLPAASGHHLPKGLYGQDGSGKTAVIDTLYYLQKIMISGTLEVGIADYIDADSNQAEIMADFNIFDRSNNL